MNAPVTKPEQVLHELLGREPTSDEVGNFYRTKEALGLSDNDAIWTMLLSFGHYEIRIKDTIKQISEAAATVVAAEKEALERAADGAERRVRDRVEQDTAATVRKLVDQISSGAKALDLASHKRRLLIVMGLSLGVAAIAVCGAIWVGYTMGQSSKEGQAAWLDTPEGRAAQQFARLNNVDQMLRCPPPHTITSQDGNRYCMPFDPTTKRVTMWRIQ